MRLKILSARSACVTNYLAYPQHKLNFFKRMLSIRYKLFSVRSAYVTNYLAYAQCKLNNLICLCGIGLTPYLFVDNCWDPDNSMETGGCAGFYFSFCRLPAVSRGVADSPYRWVGESPTPHIGESGSRYLIYNKLQNFISQKVIKLFEPNFQRVFLYAYTASSANLSSLALL